MTSLNRMIKAVSGAALVATLAFGTTACKDFLDVNTNPNAPEHTLAIGIMSYNGSVTYGLMADADALPDLDRLADHLRDALADLVKATSV